MVKKAAEGAALGTREQRLDYEMIGGTHELLPNLTLQKIMHDNLSKVGGITYTDEEKSFADKISTSLGYKELNMDRATKIQPYKEEARAYGSTDVGDVRLYGANGRYGSRHMGSRDTCP